MYSVVLLVALSSGSEAPAGLFHKNSCNGGGCHGSASCYGGGYGCNGGGHGGHGCHGGHAKHERHHREHGCHGGGHGCHGGSGYGSGCNGGGCWGGGMMVAPGGCWGSGMAPGGCWGGSMMAPAPVVPGAKPTVPPTGEKLSTPPTEKKEEVRMPAPATIMVNLPADATLKIDDYVTTSTTGTRMFTTPTLNPGTDYHYTFTAEVVRDGKKVAATKEVTVRAGMLTRETIVLPIEVVVQK